MRISQRSRCGGDNVEDADKVASPKHFYRTTQSEGKGGQEYFSLATNASLRVRRSLRNRDFLQLT
jgi:hypothetical protein